MITSIYIRIYVLDMKSNQPRSLSNDHIANLLSYELVEHREAIKIETRKHKYLKYITSLEPTSKERKPFLVADIETVLINDIHVPYAAGFLVVEPDDVMSSDRCKSIETYYSEDYPFFLYETIQKRSNKMLSYFIDRIAFIARKRESIKTIYFHNFSRFDGILLIKIYLLIQSTRLNP